MSSPFANFNIAEIRDKMKLRLYQSETQQEMILLELQGTLSTDTYEIGTLEFVQDQPVLVIGHHRLLGQKVKLAKPFAVLEKKVNTEGVSYEVKSIVKQKCIFKSRPEHVLSENFVGLNSFTKTKCA